jgi:ankyrin repeat protein
LYLEWFGDRENHARLLEDIEMSRLCPVYIAGYFGFHEFIPNLLDGGFSVNGWSKIGRYPLSAAISQGHMAAFRALVERGADFNLGSNNRSESALSIAAASKTPIALEIVRCLLENGGDMNSGILSEAIHAGNDHIFQFLIAKGADINSTSQYYGSPLQAAVIRENMTVVHYLLKEGADMNITGGQCGGALHAAMRKDDLS